MYAGQIVEEGTAKQIFENPLHPYTRGLMRCIPVPGKTKRGTPLGSIPGMVPSLIGDFTGCRFADRCELAGDVCRQSDVPLRDPNGKTQAYRCVHSIEMLAKGGVA
jgi:peptide/nickel transport system ATP-binding protein